MAGYLCLYQEIGEPRLRRGGLANPKSGTEAAMGDKVFLVGHGRQYMSGVEGDVPAGIVLHFAVAQGHLSTGTVSKAHLRGELATYGETITGPAKYPEHYLCADLPDMNLSKLIAFKEGITLAGC
jgi:hypothetical protein